MQLASATALCYLFQMRTPLLVLAAVVTFQFLAGSGWAATPRVAVFMRPQYNRDECRIIYASLTDVRGLRLNRAATFRRLLCGKDWQQVISDLQRGKSDSQIGNADLKRAVASAMVDPTPAALKRLAQAAGIDLLLLAERLGKSDKTRLRLFSGAKGTFVGAALVVALRSHQTGDGPKRLTLLIDGLFRPHSAFEPLARKKRAFKIWKQWWFWTIIGAVVVGGTTAAIITQQKTSNNLRLQIIRGN